MWFFKSKEDRALEAAMLRLKYIELSANLTKETGGLTEEDRVRLRKDLDDTVAMLPPSQGKRGRGLSPTFVCYERGSKVSHFICKANGSLKNHHDEERRTHLAEHSRNGLLR